MLKIKTNKQLVPINNTTNISYNKGNFQFVRINTDKNTCEKFFWNYWDITQNQANKKAYNFNDENFTQLWKNQVKIIKHPSVVEYIKNENGIITIIWIIN